ncbi:hypothetical protein LXA43DRAFT_397090 [Ganoderma leucocontextum]|nr:hypothetical protein LXA43DRAFT_397090 [Ganoderma leucocontextum]
MIPRACKCQTCRPPNVRPCTLAATQHKRKGGHPPSRKEARKQVRETRKQRKAEYFSGAPVNKLHNYGKRQADADHADSPQRKRVKLESTQEQVALPTPADTVRQPKGDGTKTPSAKISKTNTPLEKLAERALAPKVSKRTAKPAFDAILRTPQEKEEDAYIAYLERKLGWVKGGKRTARYGKAEDEDGLDGKHVNTITFRYSTPNLGYRSPQWIGGTRVLFANV